MPLTGVDAIVGMILGIGDEGKVEDADGNGVAVPMVRRRIVDSGVNEFDDACIERMLEWVSGLLSVVVLDEERL